MSLFQAFFPEEPEPKLRQMLERLMATSGAKKIVRTAALAEVLQSADLDDAEDFADFKEKLQDEQRSDLIYRRLGGVKAAKAFETPRVIKNLKPDVSGCYLNFQFTSSSFHGYYKKKLNAAAQANKRVKKFYTTTAHFGANRTQEAALRMVVGFLWRKHQAAGQEIFFFKLCDSSHPTP